MTSSDGTKRRSPTTIREKRKTGEVSKSVSLGNFPKELHQRLKDLSSKARTLSEIYSEAISSMRGDYDTGLGFVLQKPPEAGASIKIWIDAKAEEDLRYLSYKLKCFQRDVAYIAVTRWLQDETHRFDRDGKWEEPSYKLKE